VLKVCGRFDELNGGLTPGITVVYGPQASGKSTFCMMAAHSCALDGRKVAYISREKASLERLRQICGEDFDAVIRKMRFSSPGTIDGLERAVKNSERLKGLGLLIIDPVNTYYWIEQGREDCFIRILSSVSMMCAEKSIPAILTADVYEKKGRFEPFGFRDMKRTAKQMVELRTVGKKRELVIKESDLRNEFVMCDRGFE
jgi:DNA repair protein RadB